MILVIYLILVNLAAFILYGADKSYAKKDSRRIPEKTLLFWAFIGGSIGAFLGMRIFHHKTRKPKFAITVPVLMLLELIICVICLYQNYHLTVSEYETDLHLENDITIVQISDLHNQTFGIKEKTLLNKIAECEPDMIVVTGDVVDRTHTSYSIALDFFKGAVKIAPVYYITGNHETHLSGPKLDAFMNSVEELGVTLLDNRVIECDEYILAGLSDATIDEYDANRSIEPFDHHNDPDKATDKPVILLAHKPQFLDFYQYLGADLVLSGHYHGGQIMLPGHHPVASPSFKGYPDIVDNINDINGMQLVVSRGLGNSLAPVRINNYPEIVVVKVH